jgi:inorganic pyrophosphatase
LGERGSRFETTTVAHKRGTNIMTRSTATAAINGLTASKNGLLHVIVESPAGSTAKLKWEPELQVFALSRPLPLGMSYPHDWGFVPGTRAPDGDPLDALVLSEGSSFPGLLIRCRPLGVVRLEQNRKAGAGRERNDRVIAVAEPAPRRDLRRHDDLPARLRAEIDRFFLDVTFFEDKAAKILGWAGPDEAWQLVQSSSNKPESE